MKKILSILVCFFIFTVNISALTLEEELEVINLESNNLEYPLLVRKNDIIKKTLTIRNKLDEALVISESRSTCECIKIDIEPQSVEIGDVFEVEIIFDSSDLERDMEEVVYLLTNNINYEVIRLVLLVRIK